MSKKAICFLILVTIIEIITLTISIYNLYSVPQLFWQVYTVIDILLHFWMLMGALSFYYFRYTIKNIWKMQYVLRLELNFVEIGGIIKNKQFVSHLLEKNGQANGKS